MSCDSWNNIWGMRTITGVNLRSNVRSWQQPSHVLTELLMKELSSTLKFLRPNFIWWYLNFDIFPWLHSSFALPKPACKPSFQDLGSNKFWREGQLCRLPWHDKPGEPLIGAAQFCLHPTIVDAIGPAMPLKAVFSGLRRWTCERVDMHSRIIDSNRMDFNQ